MKRSSIFSKEFWEEYKIAYVMIFPAFLIICIIIIYPLVYELYLSFLNRNLYTWGTDYERIVFFRNYIQILTSADFYVTLFRTLVWTVINVICHVAGGLYFALLLEKKMPGHRIYRAILILPWAIPQVILALVWRYEFNQEYGFINIVLGNIGLNPIPWLNHPFWTFVAPVIVNIWLGIPFMMTIISGGITSINQDYYDAARIDGAGYFQTLYRITLPLLKPILAPAVIIGTIWTFNNINVIYLVTSVNSPSQYADILVTHVYKDAFIFNNYSSAAAFSVLIFIILLLFSVIYIKFSGVIDSGFRKHLNMLSRKHTGDK